MWNGNFGNLNVDFSKGHAYAWPFVVPRVGCGNRFAAAVVARDMVALGATWRCAFGSQEMRHGSATVDDRDGRVDRFPGGGEHAVGTAVSVAGGADTGPRQ
jgi:hypothetical protein